jgi:hypothetical protein
MAARSFALSELKKAPRYLGILCTQDLARSLPTSGCHFSLVAPDKREHQVMAPINRPAFCNNAASLACGDSPSDMLKRHCDALRTFNDDLGILKIARFGL